VEEQMPLPVENTSNDILVSGVECEQTNQLVSYFYYQHQAPAVVAMILADARARRICRVCADKVIDNISYATGEKF
jgi:hypothetical protein